MEERRLLFAGIDTPDIDRLSVYRQHGGGEGLARARSLAAERVIDEVEASGLRGRSGAWRSVAARWRQAHKQGGAQTLVIDVLEPEPGRFRDRKLAERQPHRLLEGAAIAAHVVGASQTRLCIDADATRARASLAQAIEELADPSVQLCPVRGPLPLRAGDSLAVELASGGRAEPRAEEGAPGLPRLFDGTALVHGASTVGYLPGLLASAGESFRGLGSAWAPGTQAFCVSGLVRRPGLYEVELGRGTVRDLVEGLAGGCRDGRRIKFVLHDGYGSWPALTETDLDRPLDPGAWLHPAGGDCEGAFGGGGILAADDTVCAVDTARRVAETFAQTACAKCLPCREGTHWLAAALQRLELGEATAADLQEIERRCHVLTPALTLCGHGPAAGAGIAALFTAFADEFSAHLDGGCPVDKDLQMKVPESIRVRY